MEKDNNSASPRSSIRRKITRIVLLSCGASILLVWMIFFTYDQRVSRNDYMRDLTTLSRVTGLNAAAALEFQDAKGAAEVLHSLRAHPHILQGAILTPRNVVLATYKRSAQDAPVTLPSQLAAGATLGSQTADIYEPIDLNGENIGFIYIRADQQELRDKTIAFARIVVFSTAASMLLAFLLSSRLQRVISAPILQLSHTASEVSAKKDYSLRVANQSDDEVGILSERFNEMLKAIQERDTELLLAQNELEARVHERTLELQREVSERKQAQSELQDRTAFLNSLIDNDPVAIVAIDDRGRIRMCNPAFEQLFVWSQSDLKGRPLADIFKGSQFLQEAKNNTEDILNCRPVSAATRRVRSDGSPVDVELFGVPLLVEGKVTGGLILYQDITERNRAAEALLRAKETAEAASQAKSEFLANMSHEIRTPMNGIIGMTELALDTDLTAEQRDYLGLVKTSADSLLTLINDILDFSKIEAGRLDIEAVEFSFQQGMSDTLKSLAFRAHQKGLELAWRVAPDVPDRLKGDITRLRQIILNLVGNAIKFTEHGEVVIRVDREPTSDKGTIALHFCVKDTGIGIPQEKQKVIFEAFTQADNSTTRKYGGTGLGLTITTRLIHLMGGRIWVQSELGRGSEFHFVCPFAAAALEAKTTGDPERLQNSRVLVIDDNATNRLIVTEILSSWGMRPTPVEGAKAALDQLLEATMLKEPFDLVVSDFQMPIVNGFELAAKIRMQQAFGNVPIILLSSSTQRGETERCRELGISSYLVKPVQPAELLEAVFDALSKSSLRPAVHSLASKSAPETIGEHKGLKILLAEDNAVNRKLATRLLEKYGYVPIVAENGQEALDALQKHAVQLILMDVQMPVMDGFETIQAIRTAEKISGKHMPIIALTAHAMKGDRERCIEAGADEYVTKPIRTAELLDAIQRLTSSAPVTKTTPNDLRGRTDRVVFDQAAALARVENDRDLLEDIIQIFLEECPQNVSQLRTALVGGDVSLVERLAHTIKGASANIGALRLQDAAWELEKKGHAKNLYGADGLFTRLEQEVAALFPEVEVFCRRVNK